MTRNSTDPSFSGRELLPLASTVSLRAGLVKARPKAPARPAPVIPRQPLHNVRLEVAATELRPAVLFDHVEDATLTGLTAQGNPAAESLFRLIGTRDVLVSVSRVLASVPAFMQLEGSDCAGIPIDGGDLSKPQRSWSFAKARSTRP